MYNHHYQDSHEMLGLIRGIILPVEDYSTLERLGHHEEQGLVTLVDECEETDKEQESHRYTLANCLKLSSIGATTLQVLR
jgi:hypothetical protein